MSSGTAYDSNYPFFWLDELVEVLFNPDKTNPKTLGTDELQQIHLRLPEEFSRITNTLKTQAFCLYSSDHIKVVAGHYDQAVRLLQLQLQQHLQRYPRNSKLRPVATELLSLLNEMERGLHNRYPNYLPETATTKLDETPDAVGLLTKVLCALSADQVGILIRAAFDVKLIIGKSFRKVCKAIAPFIATPWKDEVAWDTIRSHAGRPEDRDKDIAIETLEKMIAQIKGYR
ncbi:hypothetical protein [Mucilaginibacter sp. UYCu711]|uniref:hypothetical protein n=1 Tax=Mucilaginibacter sp. UYCu711 TaxID=3156339 RepID=UPI003D1FFAB5